MGFGPEQSLSWSHGAHSLSRDLPEVFEGLLGRRGLAVDYCRSKDTDRGGTRKIFLLLLFFLFLSFSLDVVVFNIFKFFSILKTFSIFTLHFFFLFWFFFLIVFKCFMFSVLFFFN